MQMQQAPDDGLAGAIDIREFTAPAPHAGADAVVVPGRRLLSGLAASRGVVAHASLQIGLSDGHAPFCKGAGTRQDAGGSSVHNTFQLSFLKDKMTACHADVPGGRPDVQAAKPPGDLRAPRNRRGSAIMRHLLSFVITAVLCTSLSLSARAEELVVGSFGGSFADNVKACHVAAFEKATGATVSLKLGNSSQFAAAIRATGGKPDMDVVYIDNSLAAQTHGEKLNETIERKKLINAADVIPTAWGKDDSYVVAMVSATTLVYNPKLVKTPPTSWLDLVRSCLCRQICDRRHQRHVGPALLSGAEQDQGRDTGEYRSWHRGDQAAREGFSGSLHPGRSVALPVRARRDRHRALVS